MTRRKPDNRGHVNQNQENERKRRRSLMRSALSDMLGRINDHMLIDAIINQHVDKVRLFYRSHRDAEIFWEAYWQALLIQTLKDDSNRLLPRILDVWFSTKWWVNYPGHPHPSDRFLIPGFFMGLPRFWETLTQKQEFKAHQAELMTHLQQNHAWYPTFAQLVKIET